MTTTVEFDSENGRLVLDRRLLLALGRHAADDRAAHDDVTSRDLRGAGLVTAEGGVAPPALKTARAVGEPRATCTIIVVDSRGSRSASLWIGSERAVLQQDVLDGPATVVSVVHGLLPMLIARTCGLQPVSAEAGRAGDVDAFLTSRDAVVAAVQGGGTTPWPEPGGTARLWSVDWVAAGRDRRHITVLDIEGLGVWKPSGEVDGELRWERTTTRAVWRALAELHSDVDAARAASH